MTLGTNVDKCYTRHMSHHDTNTITNARVLGSWVAHPGESRHFEGGRLVASHPSGEKCERCPGGSLVPLASLRPTPEDERPDDDPFDIYRERNEVESYDF